MSDEFEERPEHEKMKLVNHKSQHIFDFIEWLEECKRIHLADVDNPDRGVGRQEFDSLLYEYLGVDEKKFKTEKETMLKQVQEEAANRDTTLVSPPRPITNKGPAHCGEVPLEEPQECALKETTDENISS